jgi:hypothetical protein
MVLAGSINVLICPSHQPFEIVPRISAASLTNVVEEVEEGEGEEEEISRLLYVVVPEKG